MDKAAAKNRILFLGTPGSDLNHFDTNIAQTPQGPILKRMRFLPDCLRDRFNQKFQYLFNPNLHVPYSGLDLISENLQKDTAGEVEIDIRDYPEFAEITEMVRSTNYAIIGISIGCENRIPAAQKIIEIIKESSLNPDVQIILGNFGAAAAKKLGLIEDDQNVTVLWDSPEQRQERAQANETFYTGEGVRDVRLFLKENFDKLGIPIHAAPDDPKISSLVAERSREISGSVGRYLKSKFGIGDALTSTHGVSYSVGCPRKCEFCNNRFMYGGKVSFIESPEHLAEMLIQTATQSDQPELIVNIRDENFANPIENLERLSQALMASDQNIRFSIFSDIESIYNYWIAHGKDFRELVRAGLASIWIGIESKHDKLFGKRGAADVQDIEELVHELQKLGVCVVGSFIVGLDSDTREKIQETIRWSLDLNLASNQVTTHMHSGLVDPENHDGLIGLSDPEVAHLRLRPHPHLTSQEMQELDQDWRKQYYLENGPVSVRSILTIWDGYKALKDSSHPLDIKAATYYYWKARRMLHQFGLATFAFNSRLFEAHSPKFLSRLAQFFTEIEEAHPPDNQLNQKYQEDLAQHQEKMAFFARPLSKGLRKIFTPT